MHSNLKSVLTSLAIVIAAKASSADLKFVVYGDCRDGHKVHRQIVADIVKVHPDLILGTGDYVHFGPNNSEWATYDQITAAMRSAIPLYPARGNHDVGGTGYEDRVTEPSTSGNKLYYSFEKSGCHFVSVDSFSPWKQGTPQYKWLVADLARHQKDRAVFVYFHVPPYSIGTVHGSDLDVRAILCPVFEKYHVTAVFNGHEHIYYRTLRNRIPYILTGGGGAPLYPLDPKKAIAGDVYASAHNYVVCQLAANTMLLVCYDPAGKILDRATISLKH